MALLTYLQTYGDMIQSTLAYFFPGVLSYKNFILIVAILSAACLLKTIADSNGKMNRTSASYLAVCGVVTLCFFMTTIIYGSSNSTLISYLQVFDAEVATAVCCAVYVAYDENVRNRIKRLAPIFSILFTIIGVLGVLTAGTGSGGGHFSSDFAGSYQGMSYLMAYASTLGQYYIVAFENVDWYPFFRMRFMRMAMFIPVLLDVYFIMVAGGRGALVLFIMVSVVSIFFWQRQSGAGISGAIKGLLVIFILAYVAVLIFRMAANNTYVGSGFDRILKTIQDGDSSGRDEIYVLGLNSFLDSPIIGHGFGSVFYEFGFHFHSMFVDVAVELGALGLLIFTILLVRGIKNLIILVKDDLSEYIWLLIFMCGFIQGQFSGYYLSHREMYWAMAFAATAVWLKKQETKESIGAYSPN